MRDLVGMSAVAAMLAAAFRLVLGGAEWFTSFLVAFAIAAPCAWYAWREPRAPETSLHWVLAAIGSVVFGALFFLIDASVGHQKVANASMLQAAESAGSPFGIVLTVFVCPGLTIICLGGAARAAYERWQSVA
jgi:drug/metabolite transporter (DMT)-like permease